MCWDCWDYPKGDPYKNFRRGGVEVDDFDDEPRMRHPKRRVKKARKRSLTRTPCPVAEDGKHVWIWVGYEDDWNYQSKFFYRHYGYYKYEKQTCCGCLVTKGIKRETERYMKVKERKWRKLTGGEFDVKRGEPVSRYGRWGGNFYNFIWENRDENYLKVLAEWEETREAKRLENEALLRRIEWRRKYFGYN